MIIDSFGHFISVDLGQGYIVFPGLVLRFMVLSQTSCLLRKQVDLEDTPSHPVADLGVTHSPVSARESRIVGIAGSTRFDRHSTRVPDFISVLVSSLRHSASTWASGRELQASLLTGLASGTRFPWGHLVYGI